MPIMGKVRTETIQFLEELLYQRLTEDELNKELSDFFMNEIKVSINRNGLLSKKVTFKNT